MTHGRFVVFGAGVNLSTIIWILTGISGCVAFVGLIAVPAVASYGRLWEKAAALFLSVVIAAAMAGIGAGAGLAVFYHWDRLSTLF